MVCPGAAGGGTCGIIGGDMKKRTQTTGILERDVTGSYRIVNERTLEEVGSFSVVVNSAEGYRRLLAIESMLGKTVTVWGWADEVEYPLWLMTLILFLILAALMLAAGV